MGKALYRKYRPVKLAEVIGQEQVTDVLASSLKQGRISHAYLFVGPRGTGKTSVARIFAHEINGFEYQIEDDYVDIIEIDGASNRGIENIRELKERVTIAPTSGKYKIYIIDEVHMLTKEAFNALLKTLEEPPEHVIFIMATTDAHKVPATITSRAQTYKFKLADAETMHAHLKMVAEKEHIPIEDAALKVVVKKGGGSFRDSLSLLDQVSTLSDSQITETLINNALGLPENQKIQELLEAYTQGELNIIRDYLKVFLETGIKPETLTEELIRFIVDAPQVAWLRLLSKLIEVKAPFAEAKLLVALCEDVSPQAVVPESPKTAKIATTKNVVATPKTTQKPSAETPKYTISAMTNPEVPANTTIKHAAPAVASSEASANAATNFTWENFLESVRAESSGVYNYLEKCDHELKNDTLHIYPTQKIAFSIMTKDHNKATILSAAGLKVIIHAHTDNPQNVKKDATLAKISDIMGGEVKNDGGNNPF